MKILITILLSSFSLYAAQFSNQYMSFELPLGWECQLEGSEYVCQSDNGDRRKEAIIILAAKVRSEQDSLDQYQDYLQKEKSYKVPGGKSLVSEPKYAKMTSVNGHSWIDALHLASEVPGFYTRYLATVKSDLGIAITFSVAKDLYRNYQAVFDKVVASLRVFRRRNVNLSDVDLAGNQGSLADPNFVPDQSALNLGARGTKKRSNSSGSDDNFMLYLLIGLVAAAFYFIKKKKK